MKRVFVCIKIFDIEKEVEVLVFDGKKFKYDILLGLDSIRNFCLSHDISLQIRQVAPQGSTCSFETNKINVDGESIEKRLRHLDEEKFGILRPVLLRHGLVFVEHKYDVGKVDAYEAQIKLSENKYVSKKTLPL